MSNPVGSNERLFCLEKLLRRSTARPQFRRDVPGASERAATWVPCGNSLPEMDFDLGALELSAPGELANVGPGRRHTRSRGPVADLPNVQSRPIEYVGKKGD